MPLIDRFQRLSVTKRLSFSFIILILVGSFLLSLPIMHYADAPQTSYWDHLFTAVSMVCVTGLSVFPISEVYNGAGQVMSLILIQVGGLGLVTLISLSYFALNRKLSLRDQELLQNALTYENASSLKHYLFQVYKITFLIESICALLLMIDFIPRYGLGHGIFNSIFIAISAFCNAGFDNLGTNSLQDFQTNPLINLVVAALVISGGLGFMVWQDLGKAVRAHFTQKPKTNKSFAKRLTLHSRLVLETTGITLFIGTILGWLLEQSNDKTIGKLPVFHQLMTSFFQSVSMRTAGFATIDYAQAEHSTNLTYILQMLMGGAPGGTAGGLKITVIAIVVLLIKAELQGQSQVTYRFRSIPEKLIRQTLTILVFFFSVLLLGYLILLELEPNLDPLALLFETSSALATVGSTMDVTGKLSQASRFVIIALMFIGRVGPITVIMALLQNRKKEIQVAQTDIIVA